MHLPGDWLTGLVFEVDRIVLVQVLNVIQVGDQLLLLLEQLPHVGRYLVLAPLPPDDAEDLEHLSIHQVSVPDHLRYILLVKRVLAVGLQDVGVLLDNVPEELLLVFLRNVSNLDINFLDYLPEPPELFSS